jgi:hypothetical protein
MCALCPAKRFPKECLSFVRKLGFNETDSNPARNLIANISIIFRSNPAGSFAAKIESCIRHLRNRSLLSSECCELTFSMRRSNSRRNESTLAFPFFIRAFGVRLECGGSSRIAQPLPVVHEPMRLTAPGLDNPQSIGRTSPQPETAHLPLWSR